MPSPLKTASPIPRQCSTIVPHAGAFGSLRISILPIKAPSPRGAPPPLNAPGGRIAYKTGTSYGYRDAFAVGYDRRHTIAVWVGRPDNASVPGLVGRLVAAPILFDAFARIGTDPELPPQPRNALVARSSALPPPLRHLRQDAPKVP